MISFCGKKKTAISTVLTVYSWFNSIGPIMTDPADLNPGCVSSLAQSSEPSKCEIMLAEQKTEMLLKTTDFLFFFRQVSANLKVIQKDHLRKFSLRTGEKMTIENRSGLIRFEKPALGFYNPAAWVVCVEVHYF